MANPWRRLSRAALAVALLLTLALLGLVVSGWRAFGHRAKGARLARMERSPQWADGRFRNPQPLANDLWGLFALAYHGWTEPAERVLAAADAAGVDVLIPRPGASLEPEASRAHARWWPDVPWETASQSPIVSTRMR